MIFYFVFRNDESVSKYCWIFCKKSQLDASLQQSFWIICKIAYFIFSLTLLFYSNNVEFLNQMLLCEIIEMVSYLFLAFYPHFSFKLIYLIHIYLSIKPRNLFLYLPFILYL